MASRHAAAPGGDLTRCDLPECASALEGWLPELATMHASRVAPELRGVALGDARLLLIRTQHDLTIASLPHLAPSGTALLIAQLTGSASFARGDRAVRLHSGQLAMAPGDTQRFAIESVGASSLLLLDLPLGLLTARYPGAHLFRSYDADAPGAAPLRDILLGTLEVGARLEAIQRELTLAAIVQMIGVAALGQPPAHTHEWLATRAVSAIDAHLHDPQLSARAVAEKLGMSRRHLDEVLAHTLGSTLSACITETRLARAAELLSMSDSQHESITQIAFAVGFQDAAHFSRAFKARFGSTPRAFRSVRASKCAATSTFGKSQRH